MAPSAASAQAQAGLPGTPGGASASRLYLGNNGSSGHDSSHRTIVGHVTDESGKPATSAMVYLKDARSTSVQILLVGQDGSYRFGPLTLNDDFQIWAQDGDRKTPVRNISQFNQVPLVSIPLKFEPRPAAEAAKPAPAAAPSSATPAPKPH